MNWLREMIRNLPFLEYKSPHTNYFTIFHSFLHILKVSFDYLTKKNINICGFVFQIILLNFD